MTAKTVRVGRETSASPLRSLRASPRAWRSCLVQPAADPLKMPVGATSELLNPEADEPKSLDFRLDQSISLSTLAWQLSADRSDRRIHPATIYRWRTLGLRGIRLQCHRIGGVWHTTWAAVEDFCNALFERSVAAMEEKLAKRCDSEDELDWLCETVRMRLDAVAVRLAAAINAAQDQCGSLEMNEAFAVTSCDAVDPTNHHCELEPDPQDHIADEATLSPCESPQQDEGRAATDSAAGPAFSLFVDGYEETFPLPGRRRFSGCVLSF